MTASVTDFWNWFSANHERFRRLNTPEREALLDEFQAHLHRYDDQLYFEISEPFTDGTNELIITAEGVLEKFLAVDQLVERAPQLERWRVIGLKPPLGFDFVHEFEGLTLNPKELWFLPLTTHTTFCSRPKPTRPSLSRGCPSGGRR